MITDQVVSVTMNNDRESSKEYFKKVFTWQYFHLVLQQCQFFFQLQEPVSSKCSNGTLSMLHALNSHNNNDDSLDTEGVTEEVLTS